MQKGARALWLACGILSLVCGIIGIVLPLLPTVPFMILAAYAFARSSPRLHNWLINHPRFGPLIYNWQRYGAISRRTKIIAVSVMVAMSCLSWWLDIPLWALLIQTAVLFTVAVFIITRPEHGAVP
ncbi:MAG: hypothetical protein CMF31_06495 [Kordiimonas sp.]|nr:hypothetical protein [Kordiimonas sp.]|tara:strand:- start:1673 stop:2050 length:378 start_codon:yes stop_codon:yes gene_type:complete